MPISVPLPPRRLTLARRALILALTGFVIRALFGLAASGTADAAPGLKLVALGDSLTAGYLLPADAAFPAVLEKALRKNGYDVSVVNAGVSGDTSSEGLARLDWAIGDGANAVILELGANDMLQGIDPTVTRKALDTILARLTARHIKVLIAGMRANPSLGKAYVQAFESIYPDLAQKYGLPLYPFFLQGVATDRTLELEDGMHPNSAGVEKIVAAILPQVEALLKAASNR
ncbi:MAG TPA: arylesterase [Methylovirgula sp.]